MDVILKLVDEDPFDLIAMGSRRLGRITNLFLGSVSDRMAHRARLPVLIAH